MFCPQCGNNNFGAAVFCAKCGAPMVHPGMVASRTSGMAIAGFVLSFFCGLLGLIFSVIGYNECKRSGGTVTGEGLAIAGIIISCLGMVIALLVAISNN